jgi:hypothetical protein
MNLDEIARRISAHLRRFETDPNINARHRKYGTTPYYHASAVKHGRYVKIKYVLYQSGFSVPKDEAVKYLEWLDAGGIGQHFSMYNITKGE